jgi:hypothetical protein
VCRPLLVHKVVSDFLSSALIVELEYKDGHVNVNCMSIRFLLLHNSIRLHVYRLMVYMYITYSTLTAAISSLVLLEVEPDKRGIYL